MIISLETTYEKTFYIKKSYKTNLKILGISDEGSIEKPKHVKRVDLN